MKELTLIIAIGLMLSVAIASPAYQAPAGDEWKVVETPNPSGKKSQIIIELQRRSTDGTQILSIKCVDGKLQKPEHPHPLLKITLKQDLKVLLEMEKKGLPDDPALLWSTLPTGEGDKMKMEEFAFDTAGLAKAAQALPRAGCKIPK